MASLFPAQVKLSEPGDCGGNNALGRGRERGRGVVSIVSGGGKIGVDSFCSCKELVSGSIQFVMWRQSRNS